MIKEKNNENKIIVCNGDLHTPPRYWSWGVCKEEEFTEKLKENGWVKSDCIKYLNKEQIDYLNLITA